MPALLVDAPAEDAFARGDIVLRRIGDGDHVAVRLHHVADRGADGRPAAGHVLQHLGRADELRRVVQRERHQADVPAADEGGQVLVALLAQPVDVRVARQAVGVDLDHGADHHDLPLRVCGGHRIDQVHVDPLIDDAAVAQPGARQLGLQRVVTLDLGEMLVVHAAGKAVDAAVAVLLGPVEAGPTGEHQVGILEQRVLALHQLSRRVLEQRQLVHAVVDDAARIQAGSQRDGHGRVEPDPVIAELFLPHRVHHEALQHGDVVVMEARRGTGDVGPPYLDVGGGRETLQALLGFSGHRLLDEHHAPALGQARQQVLRTLVDEVPAQVRENDECVHCGSMRVGGCVLASLADGRTMMQTPPRDPCRSTAFLLRRGAGFAVCDVGRASGDRRATRARTPCGVWLRGSTLPRMGTHLESSPCNDVPPSRRLPPHPP